MDSLGGEFIRPNNLFSQVGTIRYGAHVVGRDEGESESESEDEGLFKLIILLLLLLLLYCNNRFQID